MLDEGLAILAGLWSGERFGFAGEFFRLHEMRFTPVPVQSPRIPIWVGGWWPNRAPMRRAARWDGVHPGRLDGPLSPQDVAELVAYIQRHRTDVAPFDVVVADRPSDLGPAALTDRVKDLEGAGATWWLAKVGALPPATIEAIVRQGPPR
jgi:alkanesulfonate monooxygenase SsuD/methylene tetrahydromethanopterin reductase-like flavin-dependent oxidoreductase (luciferase family)